LWRGYFAIVLTPPSSYKFDVHYQQTQDYANSNPTQVNIAKADLTKYLPDWLKQYMIWHAKVRQSESVMLGTRILLVSIEGAHKGGLADRLRSLPSLLYEAVRTERLFLMQWSDGSPCRLEEFLVPPLGGIDWTVPHFLKGRLSSDDDNDVKWFHSSNHGHTPLAENVAYQNYTVIKMNQDPFSYITDMRMLAKALNITNNIHNYPNAVFGDPMLAHIFKALVTPSPPVQQSIDKTMKRLGLTYHNFVAVHLRARHPASSISNSDPGLLQRKSTLFSRSIDADGFQWTADVKAAVLQHATHAIECVQDYVHSNNISSTITTRTRTATNKTKVYFASDTNAAVELLVSSSSRVNHNYDVVGLVTSYEKLHVDKNSRIGLFRKTPPSAFYPAFVDLWILSQARCLSVGTGGYGITASSLGGISDCIVYHEKNSFAKAMYGAAVTTQDCK